MLTFDKTESELRRPNVKGIMMAKKKAIDSHDAASLEVDVSGSTANIASHAPPAEKVLVRCLRVLRTWMMLFRSYVMRLRL